MNIDLGSRPTFLLVMSGRFIIGLENGQVYLEKINSYVNFTHDSSIT